MAKMKSWEELTISDNFLFLKVMQDKRICKRLLEKILNINISEVYYPETEKSIDVSAVSKSVRLDVFVKTETGMTADIEMQVTAGAVGELPHRMRYYQAMIDLEALGKGQDYTELKLTFIIFICTFDPFGLNRKIYTFTNRCREEEELELGDGTAKIFLNAKGTDGEVDGDIEKFLAYVNGQAAEGEFTKDIAAEVKRIKEHEETRLEYMTLMMELKQQRREGFAEGHAMGLAKGIAKGIAKGQAEGIRSNQISNALSMLADHLPLDKVAQYSQLSVQEATELGRKHGYL